MAQQVFDQIPFKEYTANGVTTVFAYDFQVLAASDMVVYKAGVVVPASEYVLGGLGVASGGTVTFTVAPASGTKVLLNREIALQRLTDYQTLGDFKAAVVNPDFNRLWMVDQGFRAKLGSSIRAPYPKQFAELPDPTAFNGYFIGVVGGQPAYLLAPSGTAGALAGDLADTSTAGKGDALIGYGQIVSIIAGGLTRHASLAAAVTAVGATRCTLLVRSDVVLTSNVTIPSTATLRIENRAQITTTGFALTINGKRELHDGQVFAGSGTVSFGIAVEQSGKPQWWGAVGDGTADDSAALASAAASGLKTIDGDGRTFRVVTKFTVAAEQAWRNCSFKFDGTTSERICNVTASNVTFERCTFDGNSKQPRAGMVYVDASAARPRFLACTFKDILGTSYGSTPLNQTCALNINPYAVTDFLIDGCQFKNLRKHNDGTFIAVAVGLGFIGGIYFLPEDFSDPSAAQPTPTRGIVRGCTFETIKTLLAGGLSDNDVAQYDDADAVRTYEGTGAKRLDVQVVGCQFTNCSKRAVKFRASGGAISDCDVYASGNAYGMTAAVDLVNNCAASNIRLFTSSSLPFLKAVQYGVGGEASNLLTKITDISANFCKAGIEIIAIAANPLENIIVRGLSLASCSGNGITQTGGTLATVQRNLFVENVEIRASGNNCQGLGLTMGADNTGGWTVRNATLTNADWKIEGINNEVDGVAVNVTSTSFAGSSTTRALMELGSGKGLGGYLKGSRLTFNLAGISTTYTSATRPYLILGNGDNLRIDGLKIVVPEGLSTTYPHYEGVGDDAVIDGFDYQGPGFCRHGHLVTSSRWAIKNAVRRGNGACITNFWSLAAAAQYYEFVNITDFRPTNQPTINSATATNGIAGNVQTRSTHGTPGAAGVAKTFNLNTF